MFYKAIGMEGRKIDDIEKEQGIENKYNQPFYEVIIGDEIVYLPHIFFVFWKSFQREPNLDIDSIRRSFVEFWQTHEFPEDTYRLGVDEFNTSLETLLAAGVIVQCS